jgi:hypothetical protein
MTPEDAVTEAEILAAMRRYGDGFVRGIAQAATHAEPHDRASLQAAFPSVWEAYRVLARIKRQAGP